MIQCLQACKFGVKYILALVAVLFTASVFGQFAPGNVVVLQAGDGTTTLSGAAAPVILKEFTALGTPAYSMAIPSSTVTGNSLVISGTGTTEGLLSRSADNRFLVFQGYVSSSGASGISSTSATFVERAIATVDASGTYTRVASSNSFYTGSSIRSSASDGLGNFWSAGSSQGTFYFGTVSAPALVQISVNNTRAVSLYNNQLYFSTASSSPGIYSVGSGTPTSITTPALTFTTGASSSIYQFAFNSTSTICYVADDRAYASGGGVQKWTYSGSAWSLAYTFSTSATAGARGLTVDFSSSSPHIYAITSEGSSNTLVSIVDGGSATSSTLTTLATAPVNTIFRGVAFSPGTCVTPSITAASSNSPICPGQNLVLNANVTGTAPLSYGWSGSGSFSSVSVSNPTVTGAVSGNYTISVSNACGTATAVVTSTVLPLPTLSVNSPSICLGNSTILTASGAITFTWTNPVSNNASVSVSPTSTTMYTVTGHSTACPALISTGIATVTVYTPPTVVIASSPTICVGQLATLTASGATSYLWTGGSTSATLVVAPSATAHYTVTGNPSSGCSGTTTVAITVNPLPVITTNTPAVCLGNSSVIIASGASSYTWSTAQVSSSITVSPTVATSYTVTGTSVYNCVSSSVVSIPVNALPVINTSTPSPVCSGNSSVISATGASTYTWSNAQSASSITVSPVTSTIYTVTGTSSITNCSATQTVAITIYPLPILTVNTPSICQGSIATLSVSGANTYTWSTAENTASILISPSVSTTYTVSGTSALGCINTQTVMASVADLPVVSANVTNTLLCEGETVTLTGSGADTYAWTGNVVDGVGFAPSNTNSYTVTGVSAATGCSNTAVATVSVVVCNSVKENESSSSFSLFPNPSNGNVVVKCALVPVKMTVYDMLGKQVFEKTLTDLETLINFQDMDNGLYQVIISHNQSQRAMKVIIDK